MQQTVSFKGYERVYDTGIFDESVWSNTQTVFNRYREKGVILPECSVEDSIWKITDEKHTVKLDFSMSEVKYVQAAMPWTNCDYVTCMKSMKTYTVMCMGRYIPNTLQRNVRLMSSIATTPLDNLYIPPECQQAALEFLALLPGNTDDKRGFMKSLTAHSEENAKASRVLAPFSTYLSFEDNLSRYWDSASPAERARFFPIYMWWTVTAILPLRPTEFLLTPCDCLKETDGRFFLTIRRTHLKGGSDKYVAYKISEDYDCYTYEIPGSIAAGILDYQKETKDCMRNMGLLFIPPENCRYLSYDQLRQLLQEMLLQLQMPEDCIHLGDTRHISMISLILTGDTPSICKKLAEHASIETSLGYYSNMSTLNDCRVLRFLQMNLVASAPELKFRRAVSTEGMLRLSNGYCDYQQVSNLDPFECCKSWSFDQGLGSCISCPHFIPDSSFRIDLKMRTLSEIQEEFAFLMDSVEMLRKSQGKQETIEQILNRLKSSVMKYLILSEREAPYYGKTEKIQ